MKAQRGANFGDMKHFKVSINDMDITESVVSAHVFQDMLSPTNTCIVNLNDTNNLLMNLPIRAGATLDIEVETELGSDGDGVQVWEMMVYRVGEKNLQNSKQQTYAVFGADPVFIRNQTKRIHKGFQKQSNTTMARSIFKEFLKADLADIDPTTKVSHLLVPGWTPFNTIGFLLRTALFEDAADYTCYQKWDGTFAMKSFENLYSNPAESSGITFRMAPTGIRTNGDTEIDYGTVINKYHFEHFDALTNLASGFYSNKLVSFDYVTKSWAEKDFKFGDDSPEDKAMGKLDSDIFTDSNNVNITWLPKNGKLFDGAGSYVDDADSWQTSRKSAMMKFEQEKLMIQFPGGAACARWFAKNCVVDLPSQDYMSDDKYDKYRRGKYLITSMAHMYNKDAYMINAELVKKRLEE